MIAACCDPHFFFFFFWIFREIDGKTYIGVVKEKEKAKQQYQKAVSSGQTAGLVKWEEKNKQEV